MLEKLTLYMTFPYVRYALIVGTLIALCSSLLGVILVLKRFSYIGDGLSHVAFGALAIATVLNFTNRMIIILPITVLTAILILKNGNNSKVKGDAVIAMLSVGALFTYEFISCIGKCIRRCMLHTIWLHLTSDTYKLRGMGKWNPIYLSSGRIYLFIQQDICSYI